MEQTEDASEPLVAGESSGLPLLSDADTQVLTEARTASWRIEQYEFAYDFDVRTISFRQTVLDFLGVMIAVIFIFFTGCGPRFKGEEDGWHRSSWPNL